MASLQLNNVPQNFNYQLGESAPIKVKWVAPTYTDWKTIPSTKILTVTSITPRENIIEWSKLPDEYTVTYLYIQKSENEENGWRTIGRWDFGSTYEFNDTTGSTSSHRHGMEYYRLVMPEIKTIIGNACYEGTMEPYGLEVARRNRIKLKQGKCGNKCYALVRMRDGARCPECWNEMFQKRTRSNCPTCNDTGYIIGYYNPIVIYVNFGPETAIIHAEIDGPTNPADEVSGWTGNYPLLANGDAIVEANSLRVWIVKQIQVTTYRRIITKQIITIKRSTGDDRTMNILSKLPKEDHNEYQRYALSPSGQGFFSPHNDTLLRRP